MAGREVQVDHRSIVYVRRQRVMLDAHLAVLYGVPTKALVQAVQRNKSRFPPDFMFRLTLEEAANLRSQFVTSSSGRAWGGRRTPPYAFTEQGVAMLSSVLRSRRAIDVNIAVMRAFVRLRQLMLSNEELARRLSALEKKYDRRFRVVFDAIRHLMSCRQRVVRRSVFGRGRTASLAPPVGPFSIGRSAARDSTPSAISSDASPDRPICR